jgi:HAE1 family hydrophobic/amphiphilic exporter-1
VKTTAIVAVLASVIGAGGWYYYHQSDAAGTEAASPAAAAAAGRGDGRGRGALAMSVDSAVSLRDPFIVMFSVPVAAIGVVGALKLTATSFSLQAYIGVIMLAGIVVSNAILLVDYTNVLRRRDGLPLREAVEQAGRTRLRPILMTTLATILGLVPMSLGSGEGAELQAPLARVVIGGLPASTLVTLVLVPSVYTLFEEGFSKGNSRPAPSLSAESA